MKAIVNPEVAKFVDGLVARHVVSADPHVVERLKVEVEDFLNHFATADETEPAAAETKSAVDETNGTKTEPTDDSGDKGDGSESN